MHETNAYPLPPVPTAPTSLWGFNEKEMDGAIFHFQEIQNEYPLFWTALLFIIGQSVNTYLPAHPILLI